MSENVAYSGVHIETEDTNNNYEVVDLPSQEDMEPRESGVEEASPVLPARQECSQPQQKNRVAGAASPAATNNPLYETRHSGGYDMPSKTADGYSHLEYTK